jgi:hypothetical protein
MISDQGLTRTLARVCIVLSALANYGALAMSLFALGGCAAERTTRVIGDRQSMAVPPPARGLAPFSSKSGCIEHAAANCPTSVQGVYNACVAATTGNGSPSCPWAGWEATVNTLPAGGESMDSGVNDIGGGLEVYFPAGNYSMISGVSLKPGWTVRGAGAGATSITTSPQLVSDAFRMALKLNSSNYADVRIEDLAIFNGGSRTDSVGIDIVGGSHVHIARVKVHSFAYDVILDQAEVADIFESDLAGTVAGIWLVNGSDHTPGATSGFTNVVRIRDTHVVSLAPEGYGILDDGGYSHTVDGCNLVGGGTLIRSACTVLETITNNYFEGAAFAEIATADTTLKGVGCGGDSNLTISGNELVSHGHPAVILGSPYEVFMNNNFFNSSVAAVRGVSSAGVLVALANTQDGTGPLFDSTPTRGLLTHGASKEERGVRGAALLDVAGGMRLIGTERPLCSAATRGTFWVAAGGPRAKDQVQVCAKDAADTYGWRTIY